MPDGRAFAREDHDDRTEASRGLVLVFLLAALAGAVDATGLAKLRDHYVSFMSGNTTSLGAAMARGDVATIEVLATLIGLFVAGAAAGSVAATLAGSRHLPVVVAGVAMVLAVPVAVPGLMIPAMVVAMGGLNAAIQHAGPVMVSVTYISGSLVKVGQGIGRWLCGRRDDWTWLAQPVPWLGLLLGAIFGAVLRQRLGATVFWPFPAFALVVAGAAAMDRPPASARRPARWPDGAARGAAGGAERR